MYKYKVGYGGYENSNFVELLHKEAFVQEEFEDLMADAVHYAIAESQVHKNSFEALMPQVVGFLIQEKGFIAEKYHIKWALFGWTDITLEGDWAMEEEDDYELYRLRENLKKRGVQIRKTRR